MQELVGEWTQFVSDHQSYDDSYHAARDFIADTNFKLEPFLSDASLDDKFSLQIKQTKLSDLIASLDEGTKKVQAAVEASNKALASTSSVGREVIEHDLAELQQTLDDTAVQMKDAKARQDVLLRQMTERDNTAAQLADWLRQVEGELKQEASVLPATLTDRRTQLERIKVGDSA